MATPDQHVIKQPAATPIVTATETAYLCPNAACAAPLKSPYHTVCPRCAEPISPGAIQAVLGHVDFMADPPSTGLSKSVVVAAVVVGVVLLAVLVWSLIP